jgi:sec-independent protein translocase protein TatC
LRWLLVRSTLAIVIMAFATAITCLTLFLVRYGQHLQPINFCDLSQSLGLTDSFCITEFYHTEHLYGGTGKCVYLGLSSCRFILSFPYILWKYGNL